MKKKAGERGCSKEDISLSPEKHLRQFDTPFIFGGRGFISYHLIESRVF